MSTQRGPVTAQGERKRLTAPLAGLAAGVALLLLSVILYLCAMLYGPGPRAMTEVTFTRGMSVGAMGRELQTHGVIKSATLFRVMARLRGHENGLQAGTYDFPAGISLIGALRQMEEGKVVITQITIPEGRTSAQAVRILMAAPNLTGDVDVPPEGSILPETYQYQRGETRQAVLNRMLEAQRKLLDTLWKNRAPGLPYADKDDAVVMASIIERETALPAERPHIASVFINRLKQGIRLGSDPTVIYGISKGEPLGRGLTRDEIDTPTPWNTYQIDKLPVTPICNPGKASLEAALNPAKTQDLYFVANGTGGHVFAATYEEHLANVAKWRAMEGSVEVYTSSAWSDDSASGVQPSAVVVAAKPAAAVQLRGKVH